LEREWEGLAGLLEVAGNFLAVLVALALIHHLGAFQLQPDSVPLDADLVEGNVLGPLVRAVHGAAIGAVLVLEQVKGQADLDAADFERALEDLFRTRRRSRFEEEAGDLAVLVEHHARVQFLLLELASHKDDVVLAALLDPAAELFLEGTGVADDFLPGA